MKTAIKKYLDHKCDKPVNKCKHRKKLREAMEAWCNVGT